MDQSPPRETSQGRDDDVPRFAEPRIGFFAKLRAGSTSNPLMAMVIFSSIACLAGWGALSILYHVVCWLFGPAHSGEVIAATVFCILIAGLVWLVWWCGDRVERFFGLKPIQVQTAPPQHGLPFWKDWRTIAACLFLFYAAKGIDRSLPPKRPIDPLPDTGGMNAGRSPGLMPQNIVNQGLQRRQATLVYWQIAVANLHRVRFDYPSGQESAEKFYEGMFQQLKSSTNAARSAPTTNVDADLAQMAMRHLTLEDQWFELKSGVEKLIQSHQNPTPTDTIDERMDLTQAILNRLSADPEAIEKLPPSPERDLVEKSLGLEQARLEQFREIEIMQAVLQERYKGTPFPLPSVRQ